MAYKYANRLHLPAPLLQAIVNDPYSGSGYTASMFARPVQIIELEKRHEITVDISDMIYPLIGNNTHYILERMGIKNALQEERLFAKVGKERISGKIDHYTHDHVLQDWKITTRWVLIDGAKYEWVVQLNIDAFLLVRNNFPVRKIEVVAMFRDWSKTQAAKNPLYPKSQVAILPVELWPMERTRNYIEDRLTVFYAAQELSDRDLPVCTPEERWEKPTTYAVKKKGNKKAARVLASMGEAEEYIKDKELGDNYLIEKRLGESTRCEYYCNVKNICHQYRRYSNSKKLNKGEE